MRPDARPSPCTAMDASDPRGEIRLVDGAAAGARRAGVQRASGSHFGPGARQGIPGSGPATTPRPDRKVRLSGRGHSVLQLLLSWPRLARCSLCPVMAGGMWWSGWDSGGCLGEGDFGSVLARSPAGSGAGGDAVPAQPAQHGPGQEDGGLAWRARSSRGSPSRRVWPRRDQVRVVGGVIENPASSSKTSQASSAATVLPPAARSPSSSRPPPPRLARPHGGREPGSSSHAV